MIHVVIEDGAGKIRTVPTDFVTASRIVRAAALAGKGALIRTWTRSETREWTRMLEAGEAISSAIALFEGSCPCTIKQTADVIQALVPCEVLTKSDNGTAFFLQPLAPLPVATTPQGTAEAPNLTHGAPTEEAGDA